MSLYDVFDANLWWMWPRSTGFEVVCVAAERSYYYYLMCSRWQSLRLRWLVAAWQNRQRTMKLVMKTSFFYSAAAALESSVGDNNDDSRVLIITLFGHKPTMQTCNVVLSLSPSLLLC